MADVTIDSAFQGASARAMRALVWKDADVGYHFYFETGTTFVYSKTADGGASWGASVLIATAAGGASVQVAFDVWFDKWTSGDSGTLIHLAWFDTGTDDVFYRTLDVSSDTLGTQQTVFVGASAAAGAGAFCSIAKMRGGNLYVAFDIDAGAELGLRRSVDAGVNWTARDTGTPIEATLDWAMLFPGNEADNQDCWMLYFDASADALTLKMHDDSAATTSESATIATIVENATDLTGQYPFSGAIRHSDGHLIVALVTERDTITADHRVFDINGTASITELTAVTTDIDDHYYPSVFINQLTNDIYVAFNGLRTGGETLDTTTKVYYTKSTDGGTSWTAGSTAYMEDAAAVVLQTWCAPSGLRFYVSWRQGSTTLIGNKVNSLAFSAEENRILFPMSMSGVGGGRHGGNRLS